MSFSVNSFAIYQQKSQTVSVHWDTVAGNPGHSDVKIMGTNWEDQRDSVHSNGTETLQVRKLTNEFYDEDDGFTLHIAIVLSPETCLFTDLIHICSY